MNYPLFITGTDTDVGKTFVSGLLLQAFEQAGLKTVALKPIASGCERNAEGELRNQDALYLQKFATIKTPYAMVNPIAFEPPIAPHIAADLAGMPLTAASVKRAIVGSTQEGADLHLIEGAGGWALPLNAHELLSDVILDLQIPIILVVGIKLGCLNHALLTHFNIMARGGIVLGWIANCLDPNTLAIEDNICFLKNKFATPCLGVVPFHAKSSACLDITTIRERLISKNLLAK